MSASCPYLGGRLLIRNQQVVGSNPTGGSRKSSKIKHLYAALRARLRGYARKLCSFLGVLLAKLALKNCRELARAEIMHLFFTHEETFALDAGPKLCPSG